MARRIYERARSPKGVRDIIPAIQAIVGNGFTSPASAFFQGPSADVVNEPRVLGLPAAWRSVNFLANGVASMAPMRMLDADGVPLPYTPTVVSRPNAAIQPFEFFHTAVACAVMHGNYIGLLADFDPTTYYPRQVVPVPLTAVTECRYVDGVLRYVIDGVPYGALDVVHIRGYTLPGSPWGIGVVEAFRRGLAMAREQQELAADTYKRGSVPSGILTVPVARPDKTQVEEAQESWIESHGGSRKPAVLAQGWDFKPLQWSPEDAEFLASRLFSIAEMALMFGLDPTDLGASFPAGSTPSMTYANMAQRQVARSTDAYLPWTLRFEQAWSDLVPGSARTEFDPARLFRLDPQTQADVDQKNIASGVTSPDEARAAQGKKPLPKPKPAPVVAPAPLPSPEGAPLIEPKSVAVKV